MADARLTEGTWEGLELFYVQSCDHLMLTRQRWGLDLLSALLRLSTVA